MPNVNPSTFPSFTILSAMDMDFLRTYYPNISGYSDFNLMSIWGYMNKDCLWSILDDTLIYQFRDYLSGSKFVTFTSNKLSINTIDQIVSFVKSNDSSLSQTIKLIPETTISQISGSDIGKYPFELDRDNFDYILDIPETANVAGSKFESKRHEYNRFVKKSVNFEINEYSQADDQLLAEITFLFKEWADDKKLTDWQHEFESLMRAISDGLFSFSIFTLRVGGVLAGFTVIEPISSSTVMLHYWKTKGSITNAYGYMMIEISRILSNRGYSLLNFQQDIGLPHLRESKLRWHPKDFLKKYRLTLI